MRSHIIAVSTCAIVAGSLSFLAFRGSDRTDASTLVATSLDRETRDTLESLGLAVDSFNVEAGKVPLGSTFEHTFQLTNRGKAAVTIESLLPDCGCTTTLPGRHVVEPGKTLGIPFYLHTNGLTTEPFARAITATLNDGHSTRKAHFRVNGTIVDAQVVRVFPDVIDLPGSDGGGSVQGVFYVKGPKDVIQQIPKVIEVAAGETREVRVPSSGADMGENVELQEVAVRLKPGEGKERGSSPVMIEFRDVNHRLLQSVRVNAR